MTNKDSSKIREQLLDVEREESTQASTHCCCSGFKDKNIVTNKLSIKGHNKQSDKVQEYLILDNIIRSFCVSLKKKCFLQISIMSEPCYSIIIPSASFL